MKLLQLVHHGLAATALFSLPLAAALVPASNLVAATVSPPITTVAPQVPRGLGKPCVVELFHGQAFPGEAGPLHYTYMPPPDCPKPWAKVILQLDISGSRSAGVSQLGVYLAGVPVFRGASPKYDDGASWHVERDLTEDAALLRLPQDGLILSYGDDTFQSPQTDITGSGKLLFYRTSANTPAPQVPDSIIPLGPEQPPLVLPHNIVRVYLDVFNAHPWWFTCVPDQSADEFYALQGSLAPGDLPQQGIFPPGQGCRGGSFIEEEVTIDGIPAGIVPAFPLLTADFNSFLRNAVDQPTTPSQMLNFIPYRVDLTPFAGLLNDAGPHSIHLQRVLPPFDSGAPDGQLLLYLDPGRVQVSGGVTLNTLTGSSSTPTVTNTLSASGDVLRGRVITRFNRHFEIRGFVNTSKGQIWSSVVQSGSFSNTQVFHLFGLGDHSEPPVNRLYEQNLWLNSTVNRTSRRRIGAKVISNDQERVSYPLRLRYHAEGVVVDNGDGTSQIEPTKASTVVHQARLLNGDHYRAGLVRYLTDLDDVFDAIRTGTIWKSSAQYSFDDNLGSCYQSALTTHDGSVDARVQGVGCAHRLNRVRWFVHPDGSTDNLDWVH